MRKKILFLFTFLSTFFLYSQNNNYVKGELLIQITDNEKAHKITNQFQKIGMSRGEVISSHMNIWKFYYSNDDLRIEDAIEMMYENKYVIVAQKNHILQQRATPNDQFIDNQWQYYQTNDKDIDMFEAWDETTGGLTANGDTIVVCVIDDGIRASHPDIKPNLWKNYNEIPENNIDDDGNGYIDDVNGWNSKNNNNNPSHSSGFEGHGTAVAGIIGAKGNNGIGVSGVNWDVKLMIVKGVGNESQAIAAYNYALSNRKLYNQTNGSKGAFVVATNTSWGIDNVFASQAPLWCAFYDTLGKYGILNVGATTNSNKNVDVTGDLPTTCPSQYLLSVTNTKNNDVKETQAGYGSISIDLGAPGTNTYTVARFGHNYDYFGGTSAATPHVAGTIALLYSIDCKNFANLAKKNPKVAAEKIRDFILNNVDPNSSLNSITTTGGRLNVNNAILALKNKCNNLKIEEENQFISNLSIFPNPISNNELNIRYKSKNNEKLKISIFDISGKQIISKQIHSKIGSNLYKLPLHNIEKGIYNLTILSNKKQVNLKFIK